MRISKTIQAAQELVSPSTIQFSPPRTGSTLVWNLLRLAFPERRVLKQHRLSTFQRSRLYRSPIVCSVRNPLDSIASSLERYQQQPTDQIIDEQIAMYEHQGLWQTLELIDNPRASVLRYEDFVNDWPYLFSAIESALGKTISPSAIRECYDRFSIDVVESRCKQLGHFDNYDPVDHIHGCHISQYRGRVNYFDRVLTHEMTVKIYEHFQPVFAAFDYPRPQAASVAEKRDAA